MGQVAEAGQDGRDEDERRRSAEGEHERRRHRAAGKRAYSALAETYGKKIGAYKSPMYQSMKVEKNRIRVYFANAENGLKSTDKTIPHVQIAGEDKKFVEANAEIKGNKLVVFNKTVKNPVAVRYCFDNAAISNVFSQEGLPVAPFRTDDWEVDTITVKQ